MGPVCGFQRLTPDLIEVILTQFAQGTAEREDPVPEWSKAYILLRVMFLPPYKTPTVTEPLDLENNVGGGFVGMLPEHPVFGYSWSMPLEWTDHGPIMTAWLGGYSGPAYQPAIEYRILAKCCHYRTLRSVPERAP